MDSNTRQRRIYLYNAVVCFVCTAVCIGIDIHKIITTGRIELSPELGISCALYALLIFLGIRAIRKYRNFNSENL